MAAHDFNCVSAKQIDAQNYDKIYLTSCAGLQLCIHQHGIFKAGATWSLFPHNLHRNHGHPGLLPKQEEQLYPTKKCKTT